MAMPPTRRLNRRLTASTPEALAGRLPNELKTFDAWYRPGGLIDYMTALAARVEPHEPIPVMSAAGLSAADWFRHMLSHPLKG